MDYGTYGNLDRIKRYCMGVLLCVLTDRIYKHIKKIRCRSLLAIDIHANSFIIIADS
jgi:hypothetical protein